MGMRLTQQLLQPQAQVQHHKVHRTVVGVLLQAQAQGQLGVMIGVLLQAQAQVQLGTMVGMQQPLKL